MGGAIGGLNGMEFMQGKKSTGSPQETTSF